MIFFENYHPKHRYPRLISLYGVLGFNLLPNLNLNPESRVSQVIDNHPAAVTAVCATYAKGGCVAWKAVKNGASAVVSDKESQPRESQ